MIGSIVFPLFDYQRSRQPLRAVRTNDNVSGQNFPVRQLDSAFLGIDTSDLGTQPNFGTICNGNVVKELPQVRVLTRLLTTYVRPQETIDALA